MSPGLAVLALVPVVVGAGFVWAVEARRRERRALARWFTEAGLQPVMDGDPLLALHATGEHAGARVVVGRYERRGATAPPGMVLVMEGGAAPWGGEGLPHAVVFEVTRGGLLDRVIRARWPEGWAGPALRVLIPLAATPAEAREVLGRMAATRVRVTP